MQRRSTPRNLARRYRIRRCHDVQCSKARPSLEERPNFKGQSWGLEYHDAWNALYPTTSCNSWGSKGVNSGFYGNEDDEALVAESTDASTLETYEEILDEAQTVIASEILIVFH